MPGFVFTRRVARLAAPGTYRAVVRFRWYDAHDLLQRRARRVSANCRQPDVRPDLTGALLGAVAGPQPGEATYTFRVRNQGHGAAGAFAVALTTDRTPQPLQPLPGLAAGGQQDIALTGPACRPGSVVRLAIDSSSAIAEANEDSNVVDVACPLAASASRR